MEWIALLPNPLTDESREDPAIEQQALGWRALRFTPRVTLLDEAVLLEVSASLRLFGSLGALLRQLLLSKDVATPPQRLSWARGPSSLVALARLRTSWQPRTTDRLSPQQLPLHTLSAAREHLEVLERIGCRTWGDVQRLPREGVARRFGQALLDALDRAEGLLPESHVWLSLPEVFDEKLELPAMVEDATALMFGAQRLLARLHLWLAARQAGICAVQLIWRLDARRDVPPSGELLLRTAEPTQDIGHLARLASEHLARIELPAPVHALQLRSIETRPLVLASASLLSQDVRHGDSLHQLIERLSARLGPQQVRRWQPLADHRPEHMQAWVAAQGMTIGTATPGAPASTRKARRKAGPAVPHAADVLYPSWLLEQPLRLSVRQDRPQYRGELLILRLGPQRLEASGWAGVERGDSALRDYFIAQSPRHGLLWIYRERLPAAAHGGELDATQDRLTPRWYLHGIFG